MRLALVIVAFAIAAGFAAAQIASTDGRFVAEWTRRPIARDFERNYPPRALRDGIPGAAELCCVPRADRKLDCRSAFDWPRDHGFRDASVEVSRSFEMTEASYEAFQSQSGAWMQLSIRWRVPEADGPAYDEAMERIRAGTQGLCRPPASAPSE